MNDSKNLREQFENQTGENLSLSSVSNRPSTIKYIRWLEDKTKALVELFEHFPDVNDSRCPKHQIFDHISDWYWEMAWPVLIQDRDLTMMDLREMAPGEHETPDEKEDKHG